MDLESLEGWGLVRREGLCYCWQTCFQKDFCFFCPPSQHEMQPSIMAVLSYWGPASVWWSKKMWSVCEKQSRIFVDDENLRCANTLSFLVISLSISILIGSVGYIMESRCTAHLSRLNFIGLVKCKMAVSDLRRMNTHCVAFSVDGTAAGLFTHVLTRCDKDILLVASFLVLLPMAGW